MLDGLYLTLLVGPAVPVPVPQEVLDALTDVQIVSESGGTQSGFDLKFTLSNRSPLHTIFLLSGGAALPVVRVILMVTINGLPEVLIDGVIIEQHVAPGADPGHSVLTIRGKDLTAMMDFIPLDGVPYPAMPPEARVALILVKYLVFGLVPMIIPSVLTDVPIPIERIPRQQGTDYRYLQQLALEAGYVFYVTPGPAPGANIAYWGPDFKVGAPQPALNINMDAHTNVESLSFNFDTEHKVMPIVWIQNQLTKVPIPIPIPDITPLNPPLGLIPPIPKRFLSIRGTAKVSPVQAALNGLALAARTADAVEATGTLDVLRYGRVLKSRQLVGVRGAGTAFDGMYYVKRVTHSIKRGQYKQNFTLTRNGLISTLPKVPV